MSSIETAQQRREARRKRILENANARINQILGAEGEQRSEPGLEDGGGVRYATRSQSSKNAPEKASSGLDSQSNDGAAVGDTVNRNWELSPPDGISGAHRRKKTPLSQNNTNDDLYKNGRVNSKDAPDSPPLISPKYEGPYFKEGEEKKKWYQRRRIWFSAVFGVLARLWVIMNIFPYIAVPWILYLVLVEVYEAKTAKKYYRYPLHGHFMDVMRAVFELNETFVYVAGRIAEVLSRVLDDTVVMFLSFLSLHFLCLQLGA